MLQPRAARFQGAGPRQPTRGSWTLSSWSALPVREVAGESVFGGRARPSSWSGSNGLRTRGSIGPAITLVASQSQPQRAFRPDRRPCRPEGRFPLSPATPAPNDKVARA